MFKERLNSKLKRLGLCLAISVFIAIAYGFHISGSRGLRKYTVHPGEGNVWEAALSPDGTQVAMMRREGLSGSWTNLHEAIEIREVQSDKEIASFSLPPRNWNTSVQTYVDRPLQYCDWGKYLLAYAGPDALMAINTNNFSVHAVITLGTPPVQGDPLVHWLSYPPLNGWIVVDCSMYAPYVVLGSWGDLQASSVKVFNFETGVELADVSRTLKGRYEGDGAAISPDGSRVAVVTWSYQNNGRQVEVVDVQKASRSNTSFVGGEFSRPLLITFSGNDAVLIGEKMCFDNDPSCDSRPHQRVVRDWDYGGNHNVKEFGRSGAETYRQIAGSGDGKIVFSYSGRESFCQSCNSGTGETKVNDARFLMWDRVSGRQIAESPLLNVEDHSCWLVIIGSCTAFERVPDVQMSADGKAALVFMPLSSSDLPESKPKPLLVFRRP